MDTNTGVTLKMEAEDIPNFLQAPIKIEPISKWNDSMERNNDRSDEMSTISRYHEYLDSTEVAHEDATELRRESDDGLYCTGFGVSKVEPVDTTEYVIYENVETDVATYPKTVALVKCSGSVAIVTEYESTPATCPETDSVFNEVNPTEEEERTEYRSPGGPEISTTNNPTPSSVMAEQPSPPGEHDVDTPSSTKDDPAVKRLQSHKKSEDVAQMCEICQKMFQTRRKLKAHINRCHTDKRCRCDVCGIMLKSKDYLKSHKRAHEGDKPFECSMCDARFDRATSVTRHMRTHTGEKPFLCTVCGKAFATSGNLTTHTRLHTGETPYNCDLCFAGFARSESLKRHLANHIGEKPHVCATCGKGFIFAKDMRWHMRNSHSTNTD